MTSIAPIAALKSTDVDLVVTLQVLWKKKLKIVLAAMVFGVLAAIYAVAVTPEYEVRTVLRPPALNELDALNRSKVYTLTQGEALKRIGASLESYETRFNYFGTSGQLQDAFVTPGRTQQQGFEDFNRNGLKVVQPDPKLISPLSAFIGAELRYPKGIDGPSILNGLVQYAIEKERKQISDAMKVIIENRLTEIDAELRAARTAYKSSKDSRIASLQESDKLLRAKLNDELRALRSQLKLRRENRIALLGEAISIARTLGLIKPTTPASIAQENGPSVTHGGVLRAEIFNQQIPLYFMGVEALEAERQALLKRKSDDFIEPRIAEIHRELLLLEQNREIQMLTERHNDDPFLTGIESLRSEKSRLQQINTDMSSLHLVNVDRVAVEPLYPVAPDKKVIISLGLLLGGVLATLFVLLRNALKMRHRYERAKLMSLREVLEPSATNVLPSVQQ